MTTLQKFASSVVEDGAGQYPWERISGVLGSGGEKAGVTLYLPSGYTPSRWLRLGFDLSGIPESAVIDGVKVNVLQARIADLFNAPTYAVAGSVAVEYWNGSQWVAAGPIVLNGSDGTTFADYESSSFVLTRAVLVAWANGYGVRVRGSQNGGTHTANLLIDAVAVTVTYSSPTAPTVTAIDPDAGPAAGGSLVTITGTGFMFNDQVTVSNVAIGGVDCSVINVTSPTTLTCRTGAHAAGAVDVVVTNATGSGTLTNGYTYVSVVDDEVRLLKASSVAGSDYARADEWPADYGWVTYGGKTDLWGTSWTPAEVNSGFGVSIAALVGSGGKAFIDAARVTVHYRVAGITDPQTYLAALVVDPDRETYRTVLRQLPRSGYGVLTDPAIDRRISDASFFSSRIDDPGRHIEKLWFQYEQDFQLDPVGNNTPGIQVWARVDEGTAFQLNDASGEAKTVYSSGRHRFFFPASDVARGKYVQLEWRVPELTGSQEPVAVDMGLGVLRAFHRPEMTQAAPLTLILHRYSKAEAYENRSTPIAAMARLEALAGPGKPPVRMRDGLGYWRWVVFTRCSFRELTFRGDDTPSLVAFMEYEVLEYDE